METAATVTPRLSPEENQTFPDEAEAKPADHQGCQTINPSLPTQIDAL